MLRLLAAWRFQGDAGQQAVFRKHPPSPLRLGSTELTLLLQSRKKTERLTQIESSCHEILAITNDPRRELADEIMERAALARAALDRGGRAELGDIERLCNRANMMLLGPLAARGKNFAAGRRPGAVDALSRAILSFLRDDPRMSQTDVKRRLAKLQGGGVVVSVSPAGVRWRDPNQPDRRARLTRWGSILDSRLPGLRELARNSSL
jgi:hypothetical protein